MKSVHPCTDRGQESQPIKNNCKAQQSISCLLYEGTVEGSVLMSTNHSCLRAPHAPLEIGWRPGRLADGTLEHDGLHLGRFRSET